MKPASPPTGRKIVLELVKEMEDRLYPLLYRTLAPGVYHVYLHPDDYQTIEAVAPLIVADARQALDARVSELNRQARRWKLLPAAQSAIDLPTGGWEIHVHAEANGEVGPGEVGIVSRLSLPAQQQFETGTPTTRIVRTVVTGRIRRSSTVNDTALAPPAVPPTVVPGGLGNAVDASGDVTGSEAARVAGAGAQPGSGAAATITSERTVADTADTRAAGGFARLSYVDEQGPHVFVMRKEVVSIGRGGSAHWVDVQVVTTPRVSREHCRIRRDSDGRFFLQDISTWGTSVNGETVPRFLQHQPGTATPTQVGESAQERELPRRATIRLADAVVMEFEGVTP